MNSRGSKMKHYFFITALLASVFVTPVSGNSQIKIDTIPSEYAPINCPTNWEPVSLSSYHFEVEPETGRARVVVEYTCPDQMTFGPDDDAGVPILAGFDYIAFVFMNGEVESLQRRNHGRSHTILRHGEEPLLRTGFVGLVLRIVAGR